MASASKASTEAAANLEAANLEEAEAVSPVDLDASINAMFETLGEHEFGMIAESFRTEPSAQMPYYFSY